MEKAQGWRTGKPASNLSFPLDWSKLAVSLGLHVLISGMGCQQWPCILLSIAGRMRKGGGNKCEVDQKG